MEKIINSTKNPLIEPENYLQNTEDNFSDNLKYDVVITSPPYGDHRTTVAYGEFSSFGLEWINDINSIGSINYKIDKEGLGKKEKINTNIYKSKYFSNIYNKLNKIDSKRANDVALFFSGYYNVISNLESHLNTKGRICYIVGNRKVKNYEIPTDQITAEFLEMKNLTVKNIFVRNISNKVMPSKNSPTNETGKTSNTMLNEYIIIAEK
jgi:hypothetical protein